MRSNVGSGNRPTIHRCHSLSPDSLHPGALDVVDRLKKHGYETYFAGGCVRDLMLDIRPTDFDVATAASRARVDAIFSRPRDRFRLPAERTLPSPDQIFVDILSFGAPPWTDRASWQAQRKMEQSSPAEAFIKSFDYTINALYYDPTANLIVDCVNGVDDIHNRTLRLIRPAEFRLDIVSVLRGVTQCAKKELRIDDATWKAMCKWASIGDLRHRKPARIFSQMVKMLGSGVVARCFTILERMGAMNMLLGRSTIPDGELARLRRLLALLDRASAPGLAISTLFATLFFHPIELALGPLSAMPNLRSLSQQYCAARERAVWTGIESNLRRLAAPFAIPDAIYRETRNTLLAVRLIREGRSAERWRSAREQRCWKGTALLLQIVQVEGRDTRSAGRCFNSTVIGAL